MRKDEETGIVRKDGYVSSSTETSGIPPRDVRAETFRIYRNLILICFAFTLNFTAFGGASNLQSSINPQEGLGTGCVAIIYGTLILSACFAPTYCIKKFGCKWTITWSIIGYVTYSLANFAPNWFTLVPASMIVGISAAPLWAAKCTYLTTIASRLAKLQNKDTDQVVNQFFGIFFFFFQLNNIIGSLISSFILSTADTESLNFPTCYNESFIENNCGSADTMEDLAKIQMLSNSTECPISNLKSGKIPDVTLYSLMGVFAVVGFAGAALVGLLVDDIQLSESESAEKKDSMEMLKATVNHMKDRRQLLLIPITVYSGFEQAFLWSDYTRSYVTCPLAVNWVGFVLICFGVFDSVFSFVFGKVENFTGRIPLFSMAALINMVLCVVMLKWIPYPSNPIPFFAIPAGWGLADAVWQTQLNAFYGMLFLNNKEAAFSNYRLWESVGFVIAFAYQNFVGVAVKLYVLLVLLPVGYICYMIVEIIEKSNKKHKKYGGTCSKDHLSTDYISGSSSEMKDMKAYN